MSVINDGFNWKLIAVLSCVCGLAGCSSDDDDDATSVSMPAAAQVIGQADFSSRQPNQSGHVSSTGLAQPRGGIAYDGNVFLIPDTGNSRILGYQGIPQVLNEPADFVLGQADFESGLPGVGASSLAFPESVSLNQGKLLVADAGNHRVLVWNTVPNGNSPASVVLGQDDFSSSSRRTSDNGLSSPADAIIANNRLIVVDRGNNRVLIWNTLPSSNGQAADIVLGQEDFDSAAAKSGDEGMNSPSSVWSDGFRLLVADTGNSRVLVWNQIPTGNAEAADYVIGQNSFAATTATIASNRLRSPEFVTSDGLRIYIADTGNNRVVATNSFPVINGVDFDEDYLYGQSEWTYGQPNDADQNLEIDDYASSSTLYAPTGLSVAAGLLYITDRNNHRVLGFE